MARLYADENFPLPVVIELRRLGHDVVTALDADQANQRIPDEAVVAFATADDRAALTLNRNHFVRLHKQSTNHSGLIVCTFDADFIAQAARIDTAVRDLPQLNGRLIRINRPMA